MKESIKERVLMQNDVVNMLGNDPYSAMRKAINHAIRITKTDILEILEKDFYSSQKLELKILLDKIRREVQ